MSLDRTSCGFKMMNMVFGKLKILFVENRYKTDLYRSIGSCLKHNYEIYWLVQNHTFHPLCDNVYQIPYPSEQDLSVDYNSIDIKEVISSDRQTNFFGNHDQRHHHFYAEKIEQYLLALKPDIVFGEATAFHELLTILICKKLDILYLNPSTCRYPTGRFSFYLYDTLKPYQGSQQPMTTDKAVEIIEAIADRKTRPDYMKNWRKSKFEKSLHVIKILKSYASGEKFNTPSPIKKMIIENRKRKIIQDWDRYAVSELTIQKQLVLYPLQMQPESNIDVWGRPYRNQLETIRHIHQSLHRNQVLLIKPNPKSKYELSEELIEYVRSHPDLFALKHAVSMDSIFQKVDLIITVTGTIAIEAILSNKPVITLIKTINNKAVNCFYAKSKGELQSLLKEAVENKLPSISLDEQIKFLNLLNKTSYKGVISDPYSNKFCTSTANVDDLCTAFEKVLDAYQTPIESQR